MQNYYGSGLALVKENFMKGKLPMRSSPIPEGLLRLDYHHTLPTALPNQSRDIQQVFLYSMWIWDDLILFILSRETIHTHCHWSQGILSLLAVRGF